MLDTKYLVHLKEFYESQLQDDIVPFWLRHGRDTECGGYITCLNRDGTSYDLDKTCMWHAGRMIWTFSFLHNEFRREPAWLDMAAWGLDFLLKYGFAADGSMYYALTRDGRPLQPERDVYTALFAVSGLSEYARATNDDALYERAWDLFQGVWKRFDEPGCAYQPFDASTRPVRIHGHSMITLNVLQGLRRFGDDGSCDPYVDACLDRMFSLHLRRDDRAIYEVVGWNGEPVDGWAGRWLNPGHMIEAGIFVIHEGQHRSDDNLIRAGVDFIDWGFERGWDTEFGGIYNDADRDGLPMPGPEAYLAQTKLWWQHAEALYGLLLAYCVTEDSRYLDRYRLVHDYSFNKFADPEQGEWYGLLDRRGNVMNPAKGNARKSPFHIARNFCWCHDLLRRTTQA